jgi:hypothetical protein
MAKTSTGKAQDTAAATTETAKVTAELISIEDLAKKCNVPAWIVNGLKAKHHWETGKQIAEAEFLKKKEAWLKGPMCSN